MQPMVNLALRAARNACQDLVRRLDRFDSGQSSKLEKAKFISDCVIAVEKNIIYELQKSLPEHNFFGRESGEQLNEPKQPSWSISVIDEVINFRQGIPSYSIAIVCKVGGKVEHTVVVNPTNGDEFTASRGRGSQLNGRRIRCGKQLELDDAVIALNQPQSSSDTALIRRNALLGLLNKGFNVQSIGSQLLSMLYVAADRYQAAIVGQLDPTSFSAGQLICSEAGCLLADLSGKPQLSEDGNLAVANPRLLKVVIKQTAQA